ncbi:MAG: hypothetical protein RLN69_13800, partial [Woeseiaceae bacterium]
MAKTGKLALLAPIGISILLALIPLLSHASYAIYVGKNLTADGSVLLGGSGDEVSSHWLEVVPRKQYEPGSTVQVGVDETANMPGKFIDIPQVPQTFRYL